MEAVELPPPAVGSTPGSVLTRLGRGALQVIVRAEDRAMWLLTCHLKFKLLSYLGGRFGPRDEDERARYAVYALKPPGGRGWSPPPARQ